MTPSELEVAVAELEDRVERLRALYEQYFLGFEKIEPQVLRKDVDRRLHLLRREQIRNTGLRFKMQQVISRYNTFGMYWQRILREIENGTYKRDVARAAKRFGSDAITTAAKRRLGKRGLQDVKDAEEKRAAEAAAAAEHTDEPTSPFRREDLPALEVDVAATVPGVAPPPATVAATPPRAPSRPKVPQVKLDLDEDDELFAGLDLQGGGAPPPVVPSPPPPRAAQASRPSAPPPPPPPPRPSGAVPIRAPSAPQRLPSQPGVPAPPGSAPRPAIATPRPGGAPPAVAPAPPDASAKPSGPVPAPVPSAPVSRPTPAAASGVTAIPNTQAPVPPSPASGNAVARPAVRSGLASSSSLGSSGPLRSGLTSSGPLRDAAPQRAAAAPAAPAPAAPRPPAASSPDLSDTRIKELYGKYVDAKRQCNESTAQITADSLAKSLRESAAKLRQKHGGKAVDFDVVIKDGKAVLKPVVRS